MGKPIDDIKAPIAVELEAFEKRFREAMRSPVTLLANITHYIVKRKGKQMRPMFVLLSAQLLGTINEKTYRAAALVELLHTATLVHDDVVDDSDERRGMFSINALWKNKIAVLVGDYLLSKGLLLSIDNGDFELLRIVSDAVRMMSEGELLQIEKARRLDITEQVYFDIIRAKTASLLAACCAAGASSVDASDAHVADMRQLGETIGIAFQIKDDLFDIGTDDVGKPLGSDIRERKMTLPLIIALAAAERSERAEIIRLFKSSPEKSATVQRVVDFIRKHQGHTRAIEIMDTYANQARAMLNSFPQSPSRDSLLGLVDYTIARKR